MRIAVLSDIHGNLTAFEAVLTDLKKTSPDLILHGGDLADGGSNPAEIVDRIRELEWRGVLGNTDEIHSRPASLDEFANQSTAPAYLWTAIREIAAATREALGEERIRWLSALPRVWIQDGIALVHASPESCWRAPGPEASDAELEAVYGSLGQPIVVYGHIHRPFVREIRTPGFASKVVVNSGSVSLSYDGDRRAAYLLLDDAQPTIRRVSYDVEREIKALSTSGLPHWEWMARSLRAGYPRMP